jgi:hypothetical protein
LFIFWRNGVQVVDEADSDGLVATQDEVAGAVAEPGRGGGLGGLGLAATSLAMAGLIAGGMDTPVTAIALFGMLIAGVILVTVRVFRA